MLRIAIIALVLIVFSFFLMKDSFIENKTIYEDDVGYEESPSRSKQAKRALRETGERVITKLFMFPRDTRDQPVRIYGIDVSHHNGNVDWKSIPQTNVVFAVIKATEGLGFKDKHFAENWNKLHKIKQEQSSENRPNYFIGAYHFFTPSDPEKQAIAFTNAIGKLGYGDLPPTLDIEWTSFEKDRWKKYSGEEISRRALIWLTTVEKITGKKPMIYTNAHWWNQRDIRNKKLADYPLWIANYSKSSIDNKLPSPLPYPMTNWKLWQFTDRGFIQDVSQAEFDVNVFNGGLTELYNFMGINNNVNKNLAN